MPESLGSSVSAVVGLAGVNRFVPLVQRANPQSAGPQNAGGTGVGGAFSPFDFKTAYNIPLLQTPSPQQENAAVFEQGGFSQSDVTTFEQKYRLPSVPIVVEGVNGYNGAVNDPNVELEAVLDLQTLIGINPKLKQITAYEDGTDTFAVALLASLTAMAEDDSAQTISISYGDTEGDTGNAGLQAEDNVLVQLAAQGQAVFASSGDYGAYGLSDKSKLNVLDPASQPYVTGVGGTALTTQQGSLYEVEVAWGLLPEQFGASGGGVSKYWGIPGYQIAEFNPGVYQSVALLNGGSATHRNVPDVAADGSPTSGASVYSAVNGGWLQIGGTSLSTPIWAGAYSILNAAHKAAGQPQIGFFNPLAYQIGVYYGEGGYHDILSGNNSIPNSGLPTGYTAGTGYDNVTGWGSLDGSYYLESTFYQGNPSGAQPGLPTNIKATATTTGANITWTAASNATGYIVQTVIPLTAKYFITSGATQGTSFRVTGLKPGTTYLTFVIAVNGSGLNIPFGVQFEVKPLTTPPSPSGSD